MHEPENVAPAATYEDQAGALPVNARRASGQRRWGEIVTVSVLSAVAASALTMAATSTLDRSAAWTPLASVTPAQSNPAATPSWAAVAAKTTPGVVAISVSTPDQADEGSGVLWDTRGDIVTNDHVVAAPGAHITVRIGAQESYPATVLGADPTTDLAVLRLTHPPQSLRPLPRANATGVKVGDPVMALGNPLGLSGTATTGIVSALGRPVLTRAPTPEGASAADALTPVVTDAIQTSAAINPGNSGGALVDSYGRLIGINSAIASLSAGGGQGGSIGIGFAIPIGEVENVTTQIIQNGHAEHATLGVRLQDASYQQDNRTISGAGILQVAPDSPAAQAKLRSGDIVTAIDGRPVSSSDALVGAVRALRPGSTARLSVAHAGGGARDLDITFGGQL
ncbi:trypsin-like peptidase domain-containing protein [Gephyromycinifex aptenodytis]|uniref:trypsin-like peptidase domain-containing protein n=1 Tax=Gephyromycinifex aptenodytis TaxID=2716227 RepID=UPI001447DD33|nr:trypsin-like peptidase domain-containing protein [Gephyromycinifex aptenodytis]